VRRRESGVTLIELLIAVTLVAALEGDDAEVRAGMVQRHRECLDELTGAADHVIAVTRREDPAGRGRGWRC